MMDWSGRKGAEDWWQTAFIRMEGYLIVSSNDKTLPI